MIGNLGPVGGRPRAGSVWGKSFVAALFAVGFAFLDVSHASAETRSLKVYNMHTREKATIVFKRGGRYDSSGLRQLNQFMRDWRRDEPTKMDPRLFDLIWEAYRQSGSDDYIHVVCGYRSPSTNSMLRSRSKGVAKKSQHMLGKAMDFYIPDVKLKKLREIGLKMQAGGVGYYPSSGSPFVHFDVGNVRHWPKMSRRELIALFPNGKTLHVPSDGKPLPGFNQALAAYQSRKKSGDVAVASAGGSTKSSSRSGGLLASFFGGGDDDEEAEDSANVMASAADDRSGSAKPVKAAKKIEVAEDKAAEDKSAEDKTTEVRAAEAKAEEPADNKIRIIQPQDADRADVPDVTPEPEPETVVASLPTKGVPLPNFAPRPQVDVGTVEAAEAATGMGPAGLYATDAAQTTDTAQLSIPVPTWRPDAVPPAELAGDAVVVASADQPLPSARPVDGETDEIAALAALPEPRPGDDEVDDSYTVASLPSTAPEAIDSAFPASPDEIIPGGKAANGTMLSYAGASPRAALAGRKPGTEATAEALSSVKTTAKASRPSRKDKKAAKQPRIVVAQPIDARWALDTDYVANNAKRTKAPSFSPKLGSSPSEVYTVGFQQGTQVASANRFTGKAVTFMSVAKFSTN